MAQAPYVRMDALDPLPYDQAWPSLRSAWGRVDIHTLAAFWIGESRMRGHYLEFGVGAGRSAVAAIRAHRRYNPDAVPSFFLFDSFEGLPSLTGSDADSTQFHAGQYAFGTDQVRATFEAHGVWDPERVHLVPGFFDVVLPRFELARFGGLGAAVVHIDVDLHASARVVLDWITPLLQQGTLVMFDDWNTFSASWAHGERSAAREWLASQPGLGLESYAKYGWHGEAFFVHRGSA